MGHHEYVRRNLLVCQAIGVRSGLNAILTRSDNAPYKTQKWITDGLRAELQRMSGVCEELAAHRDEKENLNGSS